MDNLARLRQARRKVVKLQRRIWLMEATFWPAVVLTFVLIALTGVRWLQRRRRATTTSATPTRAPADDARRA